MGDPQGPFQVPLDPRIRLLKPARMVLDEYAIAEAGEAGADHTEAGRMAQRIEDAIGHSVIDVQPTIEWQERVTEWEALVTVETKARARTEALLDAAHQLGLIIPDRIDRDAVIRALQLWAAAGSLPRRAATSEDCEQKENDRD